jgi:hypothetical protein
VTLMPSTIGATGIVAWTRPREARTHGMD